MKSLWKDTFREIWKTKKRFLSILVMAFLGVGFYSGLKATSTDMLNTLDTYYQDSSMYDIELISSYGLTDTELDYFTDIDEVENVVGSISVDVLVETSDSEVVSKFHSITDINTLTLVSGRLPESYDEVVVEEDFLDELDYEIGDYITVDSEDNYLESNTLKIVGVVESPLYISIDRGSSNLGDGSIDYYFYVIEDSFNLDYYTEMYITLKDSNKYEIDSDSYYDYVDSVLESLDEVVEIARINQYQKVVDSVKEEVDYYYESLGLNSDNIDYSEYLEDIDEVTWYTYTRSDNTGYSGFIRDSEAIANISKVFPLVFFIVALLISLTSMTRMVEEQRTLLGTYKALGYNTFEISLKYITYSSLATITGGILGMSVGFYLIPSIIWMMYEALYTIPSIICSYNLYIGGIGLIIIYICIVGATIFTIINEVRNVPANLMRPKAPKSGKRIFLEKITFIWKRLSFTTKVTLRNLFRYKKRFLMTIIGIMGSTALILAGFGLKNSVGDVITKQYDELFDYDMQVITDSDNDNLIEELKNNNKIDNVVETNISTVTLESSSEEWDVYLVVPNDDSLADVINMRDKKTKEEIVLNDDSFIITDKVADILGVTIGDTITIINSDKKVDVIITDICENYIYHYAYITKDTYEELFDEEYTINNLYLQNNDLSTSEEDSLASEIVSNDNVLSLSVTSSLRTSLDDTLNSLNYVVGVLIVSSGLLAFVVLYNLSNVNISERIRELSTIKVLGFYDREVYQYVSREMILLIIIGIILGLGGGIFLTHYITNVAEIDIFRFSSDIHLSSFIYAIVITVVFYIIVDIFNYRTLKKIDMVESLKSVE